MFIVTEYAALRVLNEWAWGLLGPPHSTEKTTLDNQSKEEGIDQESTQSSTIPDPGKRLKF